MDITNNMMFGNVINGIMALNDACRMIEKWYKELEKQIPKKMLP